MSKNSSKKPSLLAAERSEARHKLEEGIRDIEVYVDVMRILILDGMNAPGSDDDANLSGLYRINETMEALVKEAFKDLERLRL